MGTTLNDVAKLAGVSPKTVSNVVNGYAYVTPQTRAKVEQALTRLDYRPNLTARGLRRGRTGIIALAIPFIHNPYFSELANAIVNAAEESSLTVLIDCTEGDRDREVHAAEGLRTGLIDGILLCPWQLTPDDLRGRRVETPLVLLGERLHGEADSIAIDSRKAAYTATNHLVETGRTRVGMIGGVPGAAGSRVPELRQLGYRDALEATGIAFDDSLIELPRSFDPIDVGAAVDRLLEVSPNIDGIYAFNDVIALGAIRRITSRNLRVPEDVAVIGMDDIQAGRLSTPTLSSIVPDKSGIARTAIALLLERMSHTSRSARHLDASFTLAVRGSTLHAGTDEYDDKTTSRQE